MHEQAFATLEYDALLTLVQRYAQTPMGHRAIERLVPFDDAHRLQSPLAALNENVRLRQRGVRLAFSGIEDPEDSIARLRVENATLDPVAILRIARLCEQALNARGSLLAEQDDCPVLWEIVAALPRELNSVVARVTNKILPSGELDDRASPELARIRHEIARVRSQITRSLENLMRKQDEAIQDPLVTLRNERFVIPVKADHRGRIQGVAHGFSSSGATVFVEPMETIDANNELQALKETEEREIARVLSELSEDLRRELPGIELAARAVEELDSINAKAVFHDRFDCVVPEICGVEGLEASLELIEARHPLLAENLRASDGSVVPVSFALDDRKSAMVISGANAGGKTVVLKTAGLLSLMALSGLPVPARYARVPLYRSVLADIGDHQSLAANLSTFTSHVRNISLMIRACEAPALVLLDEVGTGTDPEEGSALGVAVVDHFRRVCGAHVMATTHYSGLKMYAANEEGVLNASVEFDEKTLQPTYRLIVGVAGSSSGLEIAKRFDIPGQIISAASELVKDSTLEATEYLRRIKKEAEDARALRLALEEEREAVAEKFSSLEHEAERRERDRQQAFESELRKTVQDFERTAREMVTKIADRAERLKLEREAARHAAELRREAQRATGKTSRPIRIVREGQAIQPSKTNGPALDEPTPSDADYTPVLQTRPLRIGDRVKLRSLGSIGIVDQIKGDDVEVRVKALRMREKLANLELVEQPAAKRQTGKFESLRLASGADLHLKNTTQNAGSELNVIGQTADEAVDAVDKFLDEASLASLSQVRIVHGHGTGTLRRAIGELLTGHPHVLRFSPAPSNQGGTGATLVELRQ